jgi:tryptophanyl-tRNA synthetase
MSKTTILTGLRANNDLQIGNYFGAMLPMVDMAKTRAGEFQINFFIPDLHSFTTPIDHDALQIQIMNNARLYVAAGLPLDHADIHIYRQSYVPAHAELTWVLDCFTGFGEMNRMTEFKDKSAKIGDERVSVGLFNYPVLMAADILLYNAELVPVGDDQRQHLEFTRDIAERMNNRFGDIFTIPRAVEQQHKFFGKDQGLRIRDLQNPLKKMSKSDELGKGVIFLGDDPTVAAKKIMSATTDDKAGIHFDRDNQPGISNLLEILALLRGADLQDVTNEFEGQNSYGTFKRIVADEVQKFLTEFQERLHNVDDDKILQKFAESEKAMNDIANQTLLRAQQAVGLRSRS